MTVKFYNLKINPNNRFYDKTAYDNNLIDSNVVFSYELNRDIVPNQVFYIGREGKELLTQLMGCTYITYEINETKFGGFITGVQLLAPKGKAVAITHSVDWWYFVHENEIDFDFHGNCTRAHVNDIDKDTKRPTLKNTTQTKESPQNLANYNIQQKSTNMLDGIIYDGTVNSNYTFLYMFFNDYDNKDIVVDYGSIGSYMSIYNPFTDSIIPSMGYTYVFVLDKSRGRVYPIVDDSLSSRIPDGGFYININQLTNSYITNMCLSDYFYTENYSVKINGYYASLTSDLSTYYHKLSDSAAGLPYVMSFILDNENKSIFKVFKKIKFKPELYYYNSDITQYYTYNDYLDNSIIKYKSSIYNELTLNNNKLDSLKLLKDYQLTVYLTQDLNNFYVEFNGSIDYTITEINSASFKPDTVNDYWTRLNAQITSISGKITELSGISQQISGISGTVNRTTQFAGDIKNPDENISSIVSAPFDVANNLVNIERGKQTEKLGETQQEIAEKQLKDGNVSTRISLGYYNQSLPTNGIYYTYFSIFNDKSTKTDLHRFGYNTFLQLDEIYKNHKREHFNYFQASDIEVTGLPLFMATDIQNMFLSGVHLWQRDIEEFENGTNYQIGLWEETT